MRVLVCGGRDFTDQWAVNVALKAIHLEARITLLIHGAALGADSLGALWATTLGIPILPFPADWNAHGRKAGPIRNQKMLDEGRPDLVVAFPGRRGTADMVRRAEAAGVKVVRP